MPPESSLVCLALFFSITVRTHLEVIKYANNLRAIKFPIYAKRYVNMWVKFANEVSVAQEEKLVRRIKGSVMVWEILVRKHHF